MNYFHNSLHFLPLQIRIWFVRQRFNPILETNPFYQFTKKLHNHEHTFVKSCCFLEALNVHSSKAETVELEVQSSVFFCDGHKFPRLKNIFDSHFVSLEYSLTFIYCLQMLSVIEPDGAENFSIGQIIQVRELKVPISDM